jgi:hypothetical protein
MGKRERRNQDAPFAFEMDAKITHKSDDDLLAALEDYAKVIGFRYFETREFDKWANRRCHSWTVTHRFGGWKKALAIIGIEEGHRRQYTAEELIENLEAIWKSVGRPPGHRLISEMGAKISNHPYKRRWGSVRKACEMIARQHSGTITRAQLLAGDLSIPKRMTLPLDVRWKILKRDNYRCVLCGACPSADHAVVLHVDHIVAVSRGGTNAISNLRTLCAKCNLGKSDE